MFCWVHEPQRVSGKKNRKACARSFRINTTLCLINLVIWVCNNCTHPKSSKGWLINHEPSLLPLIPTSRKKRRRLFILNTVLEIEGLPTDIRLKRQIELWRRSVVGGIILRLKVTSEEMWFFHIMPRTCYTPLFLETLMIILGTESRKLHHL